MLSYEQVKAIENALGPQAAPPVIEVLENIGDRVKSDLSGELATKKDIEQLRGEVKTDNVRLRGELRADILQLRGELKTDIDQLRGELNTRMGRMEVMMKVLIGLAIIAIALFSPAVAEIMRLLK